VRSTAAPYTESRLTRSVANERVGFPVVEQLVFHVFAGHKLFKLCRSFNVASIISCCRLYR
jgi:hypothetical protein